MATSPALAAGYSTISPVVVDLGKKSRKQIRSLKKGKGRLMSDVAAVMEEVKTNLGADAVGKEFVPVVIVYRKKDRRRRGGSWFPLGF
jgi:ribosomal protein L14